MTKRNLMTIPALLFCLALIPAASADAQASYAGAELTISVVVDDEYCNTGGVQCEGLGTPADGNSGRVRVIVQVIKPDLDPLTSLTADDFSIGTSYLPAGGSTPQVITDCPSCFQSSNGTYAIWLEPGTTWKSGSYVSQLEISAPGFTFYPLIKLDVE